jgi:hypothetical protein
MVSGTSFTSRDFGNVFISQVVPVAPATNRFPPARSANDAYLEGVYRNLLGRDADPTGQVFWTALLNSGTSREAVARGVWDSVEHRGYVVDRYYSTYLHRAAEAPGRAYWIGQFELGKHEKDIVLRFVTTPEYHILHPTYAAFVRELYSDILSRDAAAGGQAGWEAALTAGASRSTVAQAFLHSRESDLRAVDSFYAVFLHRLGDDVGRDGWTDLLQARRETFERVGISFLASAEYFAEAGSGGP